MPYAIKWAFYKLQNDYSMDTVFDLNIGVAKFGILEYI